MYTGTGAVVVYASHCIACYRSASDGGSVHLLSRTRWQQPSMCSLLRLPICVCVCVCACEWPGLAWRAHMPMGRRDAVIIVGGDRG